MTDTYKDFVFPSGTMYVDSVKGTEDMMDVEWEQQMLEGLIDSVLTSIAEENLVESPKRYSRVTVDTRNGSLYEISGNVTVEHHRDSQYFIIDGDSGKVLLYENQVDVIEMDK